MCLLLLDTREAKRGRLVLLGNRDEFYSRPSRPIHLWDDKEAVLAGKDLKEGGIWLGVNRHGKFGAITNYRNPALKRDDRKSRGQILKDFLFGSQSPKEFLDSLAKVSGSYNPFNVIVGDPSQRFYFSSITHRAESLGEGVYCLSNHLLDTEWFKVKRAKELYVGVKKPNSENLEFGFLFDLLHDSAIPEDVHLPKTGVSIE